MSTCTTPVDRRLGRLRRWITACVAWPLRLSFSFSFSSVKDSSINKIRYCKSIIHPAVLTFIIIGSVWCQGCIFLGRNMVGWVLSSWDGWYVCGFKWVLSSAVSRGRWWMLLLILRVARGGCWMRWIFEFKLKFKIKILHEKYCTIIIY